MSVKGAKSVRVLGADERKIRAESQRAGGLIGNVTVKESSREILQEPVHIPLAGVSINATILADYCCQVDIEQTYVNKVSSRAHMKVRREGERSGLESFRTTDVSYLFPVEADAAVFKLEAVLESGEVVKGICREKEKAQQQYKAAVAEGKRAFLMEQQKQDILKIHVGNLQLNERCTIRVSYVTELKLEDGKIRFRLPQHVAPRYRGTPGTHVNYPIRLAMDVHTSSPITEVVPLAHKDAFRETRDPANAAYARLELSLGHEPASPEAGGATAPGVVSQVEFRDTDGDLIRIVLDKEGNMREYCGEGAKVDEIQLSLLRYHTAEGKLHDDTGFMTIPEAERARVLPALLGMTHRSRTCGWCLEDRLDLDEDIVVLIAQKEPYGIRAVVERSRALGSEAVRLCFHKPPMQAADMMESRAEIVFLVDKSGSMCWGGSSKQSPWQATQDTLSIFLRSMPEGSLFNIIFFDTGRKVLFEKGSQPYNDETMKQADAFVKSTSAGGGTNISDPLRFVLEQPPREGFPRQVLVLTDGQVHDTASCIKLCEKHRDTARTFTFGMGTGYSEALVKGMAQAGRGTCEAIRDSSDTGKKVIQTLTAAVQPSWNKTTVNLGAWQSGAARVFPERVPPIYPGRRVTFYAIKEQKRRQNCHKPSDSFTVNVVASRSDGKQMRHRVTVRTAPRRDASSSEEDQKEDGAPEGAQLAEARRSRGQLVHRLAAAARIKELERGAQSAASKAEVLALALKYNLASEQTSFVAVHETPGGKSRDADRIETIADEEEEEPEVQLFSMQHCRKSSYSPVRKIPQCLSMAKARCSSRPTRRVNECADSARRKPRSLPSQDEKTLMALAGGSGGGYGGYGFGYGGGRFRGNQPTKEERRRAMGYSNHCSVLSESMDADCESSDESEEPQLESIADCLQSFSPPAEIQRLNRRRVVNESMPSKCQREARENKELERLERNLREMREKLRKDEAKLLSREVLRCEESLEESCAVRERSAPLLEVTRRVLATENARARPKLERASQDKVFGCSQRVRQPERAGRRARQPAKRRPSRQKPSSLSKPAKPSPSRSPLSFMDLISKQNFNGSFEKTASHGKASSLRAKLRSVVGRAELELIVATIIAIALLQVHFLDRQAEWNMVKAKATRYLTKAGIPDVEKYVVMAL